MNKLYDLFYGDQKRKYITLLGAFGGAHILCLPFFDELSDESYVSLILGVALLLMLLITAFYSLARIDLGIPVRLVEALNSTDDKTPVTDFDKNLETALDSKIQIKIANQKRDDQPRIFISHASVDQPFVKLLENKLKISGAHVWIDAIDRGVNVPEQINRSLHASDVILFVWSSDAAIQSDWVKFEWERARMLQKEIIFCPLDQTPLPLDLAKERYISFNRFSTALDELKSILSHKSDLVAKQNVSDSKRFN